METPLPFDRIRINTPGIEEGKLRSNSIASELTLQILGMETPLQFDRIRIKTPDIEEPKLHSDTIVLELKLPRI